MANIENPYDGLEKNPSAVDAEPDPYAPPKSLAVTPRNPESREIPEGVAYLRPLSRRKAAVVLTGCEGLIVLFTVFAAFTTDFKNTAELHSVDALRIVVSTAAFVVFLSWFYRKYKNLYVLGPNHMRCTPGWAVGFWFVPFLNLVRPIQCVYDIWRAAGEGDEGNPVLGSWWGLWIGSGVLGQIAAGTGEMTLFLVSYVLDLSLIGLTIVVIRTLGARQEEKARSLGLLPPVTMTGT